MWECWSIMFCYLQAQVSQYNYILYAICKQAVPVPCLHRDTGSEDCWITVEHLCAVLASLMYPNDCETRLLCNTTWQQSALHKQFSAVKIKAFLYPAKHMKWQTFVSQNVFQKLNGNYKKMQKCKPAKSLQQFTLKVSWRIYAVYLPHFITKVSHGCHHSIMHQL